METPTESLPSPKKAVAGYIFGGLSFIPLLGVIFGIIAICIGITRKAKGPVYLGIAGILLTIAIYGSLFYFGFVAKTGPYADLKVQLVTSMLNTNAGQIALYKQKNGELPKTLSEVPSDMEHFFSPVDPWGTEFSYTPHEDGSFELISAGPDESFDTPDDVKMDF